MYQGLTQFSYYIRTLVLYSHTPFSKKSMSEVLQVTMSGDMYKLLCSQGHIKGAKGPVTGDYNQAY